MTADAFPGQAGAPIEVDILIVGAGPVGLYGAYYAGFRGLRTAVMDSLPELGGQITAMYPEKQIYDVAGFPAIRGRDLVANLRAQADRFSPVYLTGHRADTLERLPDAENGAPRFVVTSDQGCQVQCGIVIVSGGIGNFTPRPLPTGGEYLGRGMSYFVTDLQALAGQDVVIVGGGDSAFDWALGLHEITRSVTLVHRREIFRAHAHTVDEVKKTSVRIITSAEIAKVEGEGAVASLTVEHKAGGEVEELPCQALVAALGFTANLGPLLDWGIEIADRRHIPVDTAMGTNVRGVFSAGDINDYPGKVRLIAVGFGEIATAVNNAAVLLDPSAHVFPGHSTDAVPAPVA